MAQCCQLPSEFGTLVPRANDPSRTPKTKPLSIRELSERGCGTVVPLTTHDLSVISTPNTSREPPPWIFSSATSVIPRAN